MIDESVSTVEQVIHPPAAPEVLVEEAGKTAMNRSGGPMWKAAFFTGSM